MKNINNLRIGQEVLYNGIPFNVMSIVYPSPQPRTELDMKWLVELECGFVPFDDVEVVEEEFEDELGDMLNTLPYTPHLDDGQYNDGYLDGFESGARWWYNLKSK